MNSLLAMPAAEILTKVTLLLMLIAVAKWALFRSSAAVRHLVLVMGLCCSLMLPLAVVGIPSVELAVLPSSSTDSVILESDSQPWMPDRAPKRILNVRAEDEPMVEHAVPVATPPANGWYERRVQSDVAPVLVDLPAARSGPSVAKILLFVWLTGVAIFLSIVVIGWIRMARLAMDASRANDDRINSAVLHACERLGLKRIPRTLLSSEVKVPLIWGFFRPTLILPADAQEWDDDSLRLVALHELAHIRRRDGLSLLVGRVATAVYWFHPMAWWINRQARTDCERACDDRVLACGERASSYAAQLVSFAKALPQRAAYADSLAILRPNQLDGRVRAILNPSMRRGVGALRAAGLMGFAMIVLVGVASPKLVAQTPAEMPTPADSSTSPVTAPLLAELAPAATEWDLPDELDEFEECETECSSCESDCNSNSFSYSFVSSDEYQEHKHKQHKHKKHKHKEHKHGNHQHSDQNDWHDSMVQWVHGGHDNEPGEALFQEGYALHQKGRYEQAIELFEKAVALNYKESTALYNIACGYALLGEQSTALDFLERSIDAGFNAVQHMQADSDLDSLRDDPGFQRLFERVMDTPRGRKQMREMEALRGEMMRRYELLVAEDSPNGKAWYDVGSDLLRLRQMDLATEALERAADRMPDGDNDSALYNLACAHALAGRDQKALDTLEEAVHSGFSNAERFANDTDLNSIRETDRFIEIAVLAERLSLDRYNQMIWKRNDKNDWKSKGDRDEDWRFNSDVWGVAVDDFGQLTKQYPRMGRAWFNLGWALHYSRQHGEAAAAFERAAGLGHRQALSTYNVACANAMAGNESAAIDALSDSIELGFSNPDQIESDQDLDSIKRHADFRELVERARLQRKKLQLDKESWWDGLVNVFTGD